MTKQDVLSKIEYSDPAEMTNRLIPGDDHYDYPEWREDVMLNDGTHVRIYYRTTPEDAAEAADFDWGVVDWPNRIERIVTVLDDGADGEDLLDESD